MAEDEDGATNQESPKNLDKESTDDENKRIPPKPDLGIEESKYNTSDNTEDEGTEAANTTQKPGTSKKEDNPFSFRHFLKRDLSLPGTSTYENTGARPKVYSNTVQHSPTDVGGEQLRRDRQNYTKDRGFDRKRSDSESSSDIPFSAMDNDRSGVPYYQRPNLASEPLGMPSLPDFVQDHILVEQVYLNSNAPINLDVEQLPDFTFNTNFDTGESNRRVRSYDYEEGAAAAGWCPSMDLPVAASEAPHLNLDLTESVNPLDRRNPSPRNNPLDLPSSSGAESMRLPDFLPVYPGRISPETEPQNYELIQQLEQVREELVLETSRRIQLEAALRESQDTIASLRTQLINSLSTHDNPRPSTSWAAHSEPSVSGQKNETESRSNEAKLREEIRRLKEELSRSSTVAESVRLCRRGVSRDLRTAADIADQNIRQLLAGVEQLRNLAGTLDPPS